MKKLLYTLPIIFILGSCTNKVITPVNDVPSPPPKVESVIPTVITVDHNLDKLKETNVQLEEKLKNQNKTILDQKMAIQNAITQAEKLKEKILANEALKEIDAINLIEQLHQAGERNLFLEKQNEDLEKIRKDQDLTLSDTKNKLNDALVRLAQKESEVMNLRNQNEYLSSLVTKSNENVKILNSQLDKAQKTAATASVYKHWVIGLVVVFVAWVVIKNILMVYFPLAKFRI